VNLCKEIDVARDYQDEYQRALKIDKDELDRHLVEQPEIFYRISKKLADCISERDAAKENLAVIDAHLDVRLRREASEDGTKLTENSLRAAIQTHKEHLDEHDNYLGSIQEASEWAALKDAFQQRAYMLRELVALYIAGYYSDVVVASSVEAHKDIEYDKSKAAITRKRKALKG